jgi:hypothetical protein
MGGNYPVQGEEKSERIQGESIQKQTGLGIVPIPISQTGGLYDS